MGPLPGEVLHRDVYPAEVLTPEGEIVRGRCFITNRRVVVFGEAGRNAIEQIYETDLEPGHIEPNQNTLITGRIEVPLPGDGRVWVNRGSGCGCGSILKIMSVPFGWTPR